MFTRLIDGPQGKLNLAADGERLSGVPLLFVHSDAGTLHHWDEVRAHYAGKHPTAALDRRGHGQSEAPHDHRYAPGDCVEDIDAAADAIFDRPFVLVGHSGGALLALAYASHAPAHVAGLVLVDPPPDARVLPADQMQQTIAAMESDAYSATLEGYYRQIAGDDPAIVERLVKDALATPKETVIASMRANANFHVKDFARYSGPRLSIIQPQYDVDGALHRELGFEHLSIGGGGHWIHLTRRDLFLEELDGFLEDL